MICKISEFEKTNKDFITYSFYKIKGLLYFFLHIHIWKSKQLYCYFNEECKQIKQSPYKITRLTIGFIGYKPIIKLQTYLDGGYNIR